MLKIVILLSMTVLLIGYSVAETIDWNSFGELSEEERIFGLALIWREAEYNFPHFRRTGGLDWDQQFRNYIPKVLVAENIYQYYQVLQRFAVLLSDSETRVSMPGHFYDYLDAPRVMFERVEGRIIVSNAGAALSEIIPVGSEVLEVDNQEVMSYLQAEKHPYISASNDSILKLRGLRMLLYGERDTEVKVKIRRPDSVVTEVSLVRNSVGDRWQVYDSKMDDLLLHRWLDDDVLYVALYSFHDPLIIRMFDSIMGDLKRAKGLILDLRDNSIGRGDVANEILKYLVEESVLESINFHTRLNVGYYKALGTAIPGMGYLPPEEYAPYGQRDVWYEEERIMIEYDKERERVILPTAILIGNKTGTAAENFLVTLRNVRPEIKLIGDNTGGTRGHPLILQLPGRGYLNLTTTADILPDETLFPVEGVTPDVPASQSYTDYVNERDTVLIKAETVLRERLQSDRRENND